MTQKIGGMNDKKMVKTFINGDTEKDGLTLTWQESETGERIKEFIEFNDYFYILLEDFYTVRDSLKKRWHKSVKAVTQVKAKDEFDNDNHFAKIILRNNEHKHYIKVWLEDENDLKTYEADLNTTKRYLIDNHKTMQLNLMDSRYLFYDLETDDRKNFSYDEFGKVIPENTILSFSGTDYKGKQFFFINEDSDNPECEKKLLEQIRDCCMKYSIISAWNGDGFDDVYLQGRTKLHGMEDFTKQINLIDDMHSYQKYMIEKSLDDYSLDNVGLVELGEQKIDIKKGGGRLYNLYLTDKEKLKEYNIQDTVLMYKLNRKLRFMELHLMTASKGHCQVQLTKYNIGSNDYFILMKAKDYGLIAPSNPNSEEKRRRRDIGSIGGGYTRGKPGLYKTVFVEDFSSLYPSLEITYNISPEKFVKNITIESEKQYLEKKDENIEVLKDYNELLKYAKEKNMCFTPSDLTYIAKKGRAIYHPFRLYKTHKMGLLPSIMVELIEDRISVKKSMKGLDKDSEEYIRGYTEQLALKYMLNSQYGLNALPSYRFFRYDVADSITTSGRVNTKRIRAFAESKGYDVVFSDTDSIGISPRDETIPGYNNIDDFKYFDAELAKHMDEELEDVNNYVYEREDQYGKHRHRLILEWEKTFTPLLYKKKKRYVGLIVDKEGNSKISITGLESTKMNAKAAKLQGELMSDIVRGEFSAEKWKLKMQELYEQCFNGKMEADDLITSMRFKDRAADQKRPRAHTILAERLIEEGYDVALGDKIKYIVKVAKPKQIAITKEEFEKDRIYPAEYYWDIFTKPIISLLGVIKSIDVFDIVHTPQLIKIKNKLQKMKEDNADDEKVIKTMERIDKMKEGLLDNTTDEEETDDFLFNYNTEP